MVVENVKGAQPWVGRAKWHYGSFYLWGDVPALMPNTFGRKSQHKPLCETPAGTGRTSWFFGNSKHEGRFYGMNNMGLMDERSMSPGAGSISGISVELHGGSNPPQPHPGIKNTGGSWFAIGSPGQTNVGQNPDGRKIQAYSDPRRNGGKRVHLTSPSENDMGIKQGGEWWHDPVSMTRRFSSRSISRKAASAQIAMIPFPLAQHIARCFKPVAVAA